MKTIPTVAEIRDQILTDIESETGRQTPLLARATWRVLATALAGALALVYRLGLWARRQIFVATSEADALIERGAEDGLTPKPAVAWRGFATATGTAGTTVNAGRLYRRDQQTYVVEADVTLAVPADPPGAPASAVVTLIAEAAGEAGTVAPGTAVSLVTPLAGVERDATVFVYAEGAGPATTIGEDAETTEQFRSRVRQRRRYRPQGGAAADYVGWALEVPGVVRAFAYSPNAGQVNVYPLMGEGENDRIPNTDQLTQITAYLSSNERRPLGARVEAFAVAERTFNVTVNSFHLDTRRGATLEMVEAAARAYFLSRYPRQYDDEQGATDIISVAELSKAIFDAGARYAMVQVERPDQPGSLFGYDLKAENLAGTFVVEIAKLGTFFTNP